MIKWTAFDKCSAHRLEFTGLLQSKYKWQIPKKFWVCQNHLRAQQWQNQREKPSSNGNATQSPYLPWVQGKGRKPSKDEEFQSGSRISSIWTCRSRRKAHAKRSTGNGRSQLDQYRPLYPLRSRSSSRPQKRYRKFYGRMSKKCIRGQHFWNGWIKISDSRVCLWIPECRKKL